MNNKGFTVVELITSFALTMVICVFLFEVLIDVKDVYLETAVKTNLQQKLAIASKNIKNAVAPRGTTVTCASNICTVNGTTEVKIEGNAVFVRGQKFQMPEGVTIDNSSALTQNCYEKNCYIKLNLKLKSSKLKEDYDYKTVFFYYDYTKS